MQPTEQKPAALAAVDELAVQAKTPEEKAQVKEWWTEVEAERSKTLGALGDAANQLTMLPDGSVASKQEVKDSQEAGQEPSGPYNHGQR